VNDKNKGCFLNRSGFFLCTIISVFRAYLFYLEIVLVSRIDLSNPFNNLVSKKILQINFSTLSIGLLSLIARGSSKNLLHRGYTIDNLNQFWADSQAFILMAAVIYVIATIFKKGIDIQNENAITV